jgi:phosphoesterase RecJ-like protein
VEFEPGKVKGSMRKRDAAPYDLSAIAAQLGGGGHKAAAGVVISGTLAEAKKKIVDEIIRHATMATK